MADFYQNLAPDDIVALDRMSRLLIELRENRLRLLARHGVDDEARLLERIRSGEVAEHPAYEDYLGAATITAAREAIRVELKRFMLGMDPP